MHNINSEAATLEALQLRVVIDNAGGTGYYNNKNELHREHGPAIERVDGSKEWHIDGERLTEEEFLAHPLCNVESIW